MTSNLRSFTKLLFIMVLAALSLLIVDRANPQITGEVGDIIDVGMKPPDMSFFSADQINLKIDSTDDVFAAGSTIKVDTTSADHLVIAGGEISIRNVSIQDLFAAGAIYHLWDGLLQGPEHELVTARFVCDWSVPDEDIRAFLSLL